MEHRGGPTYLIEITAEASCPHDAKTQKPFVDIVLLHQAEKGTAAGPSKTRSTPASRSAVSAEARLRPLPIRPRRPAPRRPPPPGAKWTAAQETDFADQVEQALDALKPVSDHIQGWNMMDVGSREYDWHVDRRIAVPGAAAASSGRPSAPIGPPTRPTPPCQPSWPTRTSPRTWPPPRIPGGATAARRISAPGFSAAPACARAPQTSLRRPSRACATTSARTPTAARTVHGVFHTLWAQDRAEEESALKPSDPNAASPAPPPGPQPNDP